MIRQILSTMPSRCNFQKFSPTAHLAHATAAQLQPHNPKLRQEPNFQRSIECKIIDYIKIQIGFRITYSL
jgi:hypothetical protein